MEISRFPTLTHGHPPPPSKRNDIDLGPNDAQSPRYVDSRATHLLKKGVESSTTQSPQDSVEGDLDTTVDRDKNCDRIRPEEEERVRSLDSVTNMSSTLIGKTVTPFLREHIPSLYAPIGKPQNEETSRIQNPNSRYCYRHSPDSKCRKAADEAKMVMIQSELEKLTSAVCLPLEHRVSCVANNRKGSTSHHTRVVSVLRRPLKTPGAHASGYLIPTLLPPTIIGFPRSQRSTQD